MRAARRPRHQAGAGAATAALSACLFAPFVFIFCSQALARRLLDKGSMDLQCPDLHRMAVAHGVWGVAKRKDEL